MSVFDNIRKSVKQNVGTRDQVIRVIIALIIIVLSFSEIIPFKGWIGLIPLVIIVYILATAGLGYSPIYHLFHISTAKVQKKSD